MARVCSSRVSSFYHFIFILVFLILFKSEDGSGNRIRNINEGLEPVVDMIFKSSGVLRSIPGTSTMSTSSKDIRFYLYSDPKHPKHFREIIINELSSIEKVHFAPGQIKIICPPFGGYASPIDLLKDAYLSQGFQNVIIVDYQKLVEPQLQFPVGFISYFAAIRNVGRLGLTGAGLIDFLIQHHKIQDVGDIHLIGHSLGAHVASTIGRYIQKRYGLTIGRLTGLDPAGPFASALGKNKFNRKHARFADVIHSDIDGFGTTESLGHVDYFVNGGIGRAQLDCQHLGPFRVISCAHSIAVHLFLNTVKRKRKFLGCPCRPLPIPKLPLFCGENRNGCHYPVLVGEYTHTGVRGNFYVKVTSKLISKSQNTITEMD